jgi:hypothetical protein
MMGDRKEPTPPPEPFVAPLTVCPLCGLSHIGLTCEEHQRNLKDEMARVKRQTLMDAIEKELMAEIAARLELRIEINQACVQVAIKRAELNLYAKELGACAG